VLKNFAVEKALSLVRAYLRYAPGTVGKTYLHKRVIIPFFSWRAYSSVVKTVFGAKIGIRFPDTIQTKLFYFGIWEPQLTNFISSRLKKGDYFIDVGANIGYFSLLASTLVGDGGKVFAIEASPTIFNLLNRNIQLNKFANIRTFNIAASDSHGTLNLYIAPDENIGHSTTVASIAENDGHKLEAVVLGMPLHEIIGKENLLNARIIKVDVEGAEISVIQGIVHLLKTFSEKTEWVIEITPNGTKEKAIEILQLINDFRNADYHLYELGNDYNVSSYLPYPKDYTLKSLQNLEKPLDLLASRKIRDPLQETALCSEH
jgi:FkbM family methyltransferase